MDRLKPVLGEALSLRTVMTEPTLQGGNNGEDSS
jgi:hypothetical protein